MDCTSCHDGILKDILLEGEFKARECSSCGGHWILIEDYIEWKEINPEYQFSDSVSFEETEIIKILEAFIPCIDNVPSSVNLSKILKSGSISLFLITWEVFFELLGVFKELLDWEGGGADPKFFSLELK